MDRGFDFQPILNGEQVRLRPLEAADREALYVLASDPLVWEQHPAKTRWRKDVFRAYFAEGLASGGALVAELPDDRTVIGWSRYSGEHVEAGEIEIGWTMLGRAFWGGVYNGEMKRLMIDHALGHFDRVIFRIGEDNRRSRRAVEKLGAQLIGRTWPAGTGGLVATHVGYAIGRAQFR
jgi:RimJ/RimL family protein N-acetyltransferase